MTDRRPPVEDPAARALIDLARRSAAARLNRRTVLGAAGAAGIAAALAACGTGGTPSGGGGATSGGGGGGDDAPLRWANWTLYLDLAEDGQSYPTLDAFTEATGIAVDYFEDVDDNDTFFGKVSGQLESNQDIGYDLVTLTDWMAGRWIRLGFAQELDKSLIPNAANILPTLADVSFDPGRARSLTWQSGFGGLAWDSERIPNGLTSVDELWNPEYKGRIEVLSEMRDTIGLIMFSQGVDPGGDWTPDDFYAALAVLEEQIGSGQIRQVRGNSYAQDLVTGDAIAVIGWSGDITALNYDNDGRFGFAIPDAGGTLWSDNLLIPTPSTRGADAAELINFYYDPVIAAQVAAYVNYITPVQGAQEAMANIDPDLVDNQLIFPNEETLAKVSVFRSLTAEEETEYNTAFLEVIGA